MIIRRKWTIKFTTIGNVLFEDERLEADEVGILAYLLSRPDNWEVRRPALARRWRIGRDSIKRILTSLIRHGWIVARKTRLSNGTFHVVYEVRDEAGPELSADEAKAATSLVSSDAGHGESQEEDGDGVSTHNDGEKATSDPPTENPSWSAGNQPPTTGLPATAEPAPANPSWSKKESLRTDSVNTESTNAGRVFADVKAGWPSDHVLSSVACEKQHADLTEAEKQAAFEGMKPYLDDCRAQSRKVCDLATYYRERRWERFAAKAATTMTSIEPHSAEYFRWREYKAAVGEDLSVFDVMAKQGRSITVPSRWPPGIPQKTKEAANTS